VPVESLRLRLYVYMYLEGAAPSPNRRNFCSVSSLNSFLPKPHVRTICVEQHVEYDIYALLCQTSRTDPGICVRGGGVPPLPLFPPIQDFRQMFVVDDCYSKEYG